MTPPPEQDQGILAETSSAPAAVSLCLETIRKRPDFLRAASARRQGTGGFLLQARQRAAGEPPADSAIRVGFTASKKIGNAVARNRAKRRLREVARAVLTSAGHPGWDYVLVAKPGATTTRDYAALLEDLRAALHSVHKPR